MNLERRDSEIISIIFRFFLGNVDKSHESFAVITDFWALVKMEGVLFEQIMLHTAVVWQTGTNISRNVLHTSSRL